MTDERDKATTGTCVSVPADTTAADAPPSVTRRALLRGASAAVPTILTLQSGAALAQSSNLMGTVQSANQAVGEGGNVQCIDMASAVGGTPQQLDLGQNPQLAMQYIPQRTYYLTKSGAAGSKSDEIVSIEAMCRNGGTYWYKDGSGPKEALSVSPAGNPVKAGFLVSATALHSFTSAIKLKTYF